MFPRRDPAGGQCRSGRPLHRDNRTRKHSTALADQRAVTRDQLPGILTCQLHHANDALTEEAKMISASTPTEIRATNRGQFRRGFDPRRHRQQFTSQMSFVGTGCVLSLSLRRVKYHLVVPTKPLEQ
jgi:hypothetical protein